MQNRPCSTVMFGGVVSIFTARVGVDIHVELVKTEIAIQVIPLSLIASFEVGERETDHYRSSYP